MAYNPTSFPPTPQVKTLGLNISKTLCDSSTHFAYFNSWQEVDRETSVVKFGHHLPFAQFAIVVQKVSRAQIYACVRGLYYHMMTSVTASWCKLLQVSNSLLTCTIKLILLWLASCSCCRPFLPTNQNIGFLALHTALGKLIYCPYSNMVQS